MPRIERERVARAARLYATSVDASKALGITTVSFCRLCRRYGIETPQARKCRQLQEELSERMEAYDPAAGH